MEKGARQVVIINRKKKGGHGRHGGSWKVAFADFMTAMMAFFLLMWVLETTTKDQQKAIAGYFTDPGSRYVIGPGGSNPTVIQMNPAPSPNPSSDDAPVQVDPTMTPSLAAAEEAIRRQELAQLEDLRQQLLDEMARIDSALNVLKDQILIDFTALGLRIQIVDSEGRPMFDVGSTRLKSYSADVLRVLGGILNKVPNKISVTGHTDSMPYSAGAAYGNWELSSDRANSARRALQVGGYPEEKVATVQGMGAVAPLQVDDPAAPINRRIAIIVLKKAVADALASGGGGVPSSDILGNPDQVLPQLEP
jgi:chemotaxis protein MotB